MQHEVVSQEEWLKRRISAFWEQEVALTKHRDLVTAERLRLPWVRVQRSMYLRVPMES